MKGKEFSLKNNKWQLQIFLTDIHIVKTRSIFIFPYFQMLFQISFENYLHDSLFQMFFQISFENYFHQSDESFKLINH